MIEDFKYLSQRKYIFGTYLISITTSLGDDQSSKPGGRGRYNAIWSSRGVIKKQIKNRKIEKKKRKKLCV
jgi:hypothetical protein